ncbi:hypothetical protein JYU14_00150 [Simkania negevensis]|uniref:Uncharacterized protein n=1 Tax=Simkania negevensis TaxID=83561 RepID=A0ABS3APB4_9BACT|nr:hypothetical protein [Simkania negevensis]
MFAGIENCHPSCWPAQATSPVAEAASPPGNVPSIDERIIHVAALDYSLQAQQSNSLASEIDYASKKLNGLHAAFLEKSKLIREKLKAVDCVAKVKAFVAYASGVLTLAAGVTLISTGVGVVAGSLLIAAGALTLTNQLMNDTGGWQAIAKLLCKDDKEKQEKIVKTIEIACLCLVTALSIGGYGLGGVAALSGMARILFFGGVSIVQIGWGTIYITEAYYRSAAKNIHAETIDLEGDIEKISDARADRLDALRGSTECLRKVNEMVNRFFASRERIAHAT